MLDKNLEEQIKLDIKSKFNLLRQEYGSLLIKFYKEKIKVEEWSKIIFNNFNKKEICFLFGINIQDYIKNKFNTKIENLEVDLGNGSQLNLIKNSSKLLISPEKASVLTWICTDGYLEISKKGYYIRIRDEAKELLSHFIKFVKGIYGNINVNISKIKNKNAYEARFCSKKIVSDIITYIPLNSTRNWGIPIELLDNEGIKSTLRILTQTEGCIFCQNRTRMIEITLANLEALIQAKYLFEKLGIPTKDIRKDFSGGHIRYKLGISTRDNLKKFEEIINFILKTKKYYKLKEIMNNYKEYHKTNSDEIIINIIKNHTFSPTKDIVKVSELNRVTVSRNLKRLRDIEKIDFKKGNRNSKLWFAKY